MPATDGVFPVVPRAAREATDRETKQENNLVSFTGRLGQLPEVVAIAADEVQEDAVRRLVRVRVNRFGFDYRQQSNPFRLWGY